MWRCVWRDADSPFRCTPESNAEGTHDAGCGWVSVPDPVVAPAPDPLIGDLYQDFGKQASCLHCGCLIRLDEGGWVDHSESTFCGKDEGGHEPATISAIARDYDLTRHHSDAAHHILQLRYDRAIDRGLPDRIEALFVGQPWLFHELRCQARDCDVLRLMNLVRAAVPEVAERQHR